MNLVNCLNEGNHSYLQCDLDHISAFAGCAANSSEIAKELCGVIPFILLHFYSLPLSHKELERVQEAASVQWQRPTIRCFLWTRFIVNRLEREYVFQYCLGEYPHCSNSELGQLSHVS